MASSSSTSTSMSTQAGEESASEATTTFTIDPTTSSATAAFSLIEGPWKEFIFKRVEPQDYPRVVRFCQNFYTRDEPTVGLLSYTNDFGDEMEAIVRKMLSDQLSFLVEHSETGEVAGVRIIFRSTPSSSFDYMAVSSYAGRIFLRLVKIMKKMSNLFKVYGVEETADIFISSCAPDFKNQELTAVMNRKSLEFLKESKFKIVEAMCTSPVEKDELETFGFEEVCRLDYKEFIDDMGQRVFNSDELTDQNFAAVMIKML